MSKTSEPQPSAHEHKGKKCPVTSQEYGFCPAQIGDSRSPCPALNAMANHGYISRDGKDLSAQDVTRGLKACYGLSSPLAYFLAYVGFLAIGKFGRRLKLVEIGRHNRVEHDASLVHHDTPDGDEYAPIEIDQKLVAALMRDVKPTLKDIQAGPDPNERLLLNYEDVARARIRREAECRPIDPVHQEVARGEMAIILGVWDTTNKTKSGIPVDYYKQWISEERLPEGWKPDHVQSLKNVVARSKSIREAAANLRLKEKEAVSAASTTSDAETREEKVSTSWRGSIFLGFMRMMSS